MSRVFISQEPLKMVRGVATPRINYGTLMPYGTLKFCFQWGEIKDTTPLENTSGYLERARDTLQDFCDDDYLVLLGHPGLIAVTVLAAAEANDGRMRILDWSREREAYRLVQIDMDAAACDP